MRLRTKTIILSSILLVVAGFGTVFSRRSQQTPIKFVQHYQTKALEISNTEVIPGAVNVTLKNVSRKSINGIQISSNRGSLRIDFLDAEEPERQRILPGATFDQTFPNPTSSEPIELDVLAVTFDDKSSEGDATSIQGIIDSRRGLKEELKRLRPLLEAALDSPDGDSIAVLDKLKSQIEQLPSESNDSVWFRDGQRSARQQILYDVQFLKERQLQTGRVQIRNALRKLKNRHDKRIHDDL